MRIAVLTSGSDDPGMNAAVRAVARTAVDAPKDPLVEGELAAEAAGGASVVIRSAIFARAAGRAVGEYRRYRKGRSTFHYDVRLRL